MRLKHIIIKCNCILLLLSTAALSSCSSVPPVPLVYEYPVTTRQTVRLTEGLIVVDDQRADKSLDEMISPRLPVAVKDVFSRELADKGRVNGSPTGDSYDPRTLPLQIQVELLEASVSVPGHGAAMAGIVIGETILGSLGGELAGSGHIDAIGKVVMNVHIHNTQSGADSKETWTGVHPTEFPKIHMTAPQMYSKALGGALKDAMIHLTSSLARVGIEP